MTGDFNPIPKGMTRWRALLFLFILSVLAGWQFVDLLRWVSQHLSIVWH